MMRVVVCLGVVAISVILQLAYATEKLKVVPSSINKRLDMFKQLRKSQEGKSSHSLDGADPDGIFQHCKCTSDMHVNCNCQGLIATGVTASMTMKYLPYTASVDVEVKCNSDIFFAQGSMDPFENVERCALEKECGGVDVKMCFRLYKMTGADEEGTAPHGCNDVTVSIDGGQETVYTECMPGTS
ncbi:uncharacterized protein LOC110983508 [Acanthaster planci]|uniref:Uncharacterized protein LOC110983508 n=1 Tax=Acanthaster planci TaxID=133434 RepID=A0A8B7Z155_ACAPL|nr:uncharacterized protein LOC110983508 [Acanthaster planci]